MKLAIQYLFLFTALIISISVSAQNWEWGKAPLFSKDAVSNNSGAEAISVATDKDGNVYETGWIFGGLLMYGNDTMNNTVSGFNYNFYIVKYDANGVFQWVRQSNNTRGAVWGYSAATDLWGNVYAGGTIFDTVQFGNTTLYGSELGSPFLIKYDANGNQLWVRSATTDFIDNGWAIATDPSGNVYISGSFSDTITFGTNTLIESLGITDLFLAKYDSAGNSIWARQGSNILPNSSSYAFGVTSDIQNNIYVTGYFSHTIAIGSTQLTTSSASGDVFTAKYDAGGNVLWARQSVSHGGNGSELVTGNGIATDKGGNVYVTGSFQDSIYFGTHLLTYPQNNSLNSNLFITRYDSSGNVIWAESGTPLVNDAAYTGYCIVTDTLNHLYFCGCSWGGELSIQFGSKTFTTPDAGSMENSLLLELDTAGNVLCGIVEPMGGDDNDGLAVDPGGRYIYLGGDYAVQSNSVVIGPDTLSFNNASGAEIPFVLRWQPCTSLALAATIHKTDVSCNGLCTGTATVVASGGTMPYRYLWNTNAADTTPSLSNLCANSYAVTVTDYTGATVGSADTITQPAAIVCGVTALMDTFCSGDSTTVCTTTPFAHYNWSTGDTSACTIARAAGGYWVTITDANSCTAISSHQEITVYAPPPVSVTQKGDTLSSYGETKYQWLLNNNTLSGATDSVYIASAAGSYVLQVTDSNGCTANSEPVTITGINDLTDAEQVLVYPNPTGGSWTLAVSPAMLRNFASPNSTAGLKLDVYDGEGRLVFQSEILNPKSEITTLFPPGVYWLRVYNDRVSEVRKLVRL